MNGKKHAGAQEAPALRNPVAAACKRTHKSGAGVHHAGPHKASRSSEKARLRREGW